MQMKHQININKKIIAIIYQLATLYNLFKKKTIYKENFFNNNMYIKEINIKI